MIMSVAHVSITRFHGEGQLYLLKSIIRIFFYLKSYL